MIISVGEILVDKLMTPSGTACHIGGAPFNVAVGAARMGAKVRFIGQVGADEMGDLVRREAVRFGVEADIRVDALHPTTVALVTLDGEGERSFRFLRDNTADYQLSVEGLDLPADVTLVHLGTLMLNKPKGRETADQVVRLAREHGALLSVDANFRDDLFATKALRNEVMLPYLQTADILKMSADELTDLTDVADIDEAVSVLRPRGLLFVTAGSRASHAYLAGHHVSAIPPVLSHVVDTTGAGDAFYGAVLAGLDAIYAEGMQPTMPALQRILEEGNRCGAMATQREGAV